MRPPHGGGAAVAACPGMKRLEGIEVLGPDAAVLGQQGGERRRSGAEDPGLFQQRAMTIEGLPQGGTQSRGVALDAGPLTQLARTSRWPSAKAATAWP